MKRLNKRAIAALARKDMKAMFANIQVWLPMAIVPVILGILVPGGLVLAIRIFGVEGAGDYEDLVRWIDKIPPSQLTTLLSSLPSLEAKVTHLIVNYVMAPFFLLIPLMSSSVISADSFAGEKERGTLETLLFAPVDMLSLFVGKTLAAFIPSMILSLGTFLLCAVVVNLAGWPIFGYVFFPHTNWLPLMLLLIPMVSLTAILLNVFISARVSTFQAAYQLGGLVVLPVLALMAGQMTGLLMLDTMVTVIAGVILAVINLLLLRQVLKGLNRNQLFASQVR